MNRKLWDVNEFNKINLPEIVGEVENKTEFDTHRGTRVLDMPVKMIGTDVRIPDFVHESFSEIVHKAIAHEQSKYGDISDHYVYITIDQKYVYEGKTGRRPGAHSDGYIERDNRQIDITEDSYDVVSQEEGEVSHTYIVTNKFPTEFFAVPFPLDNTDCESSLKTFDEIADNAYPIKYPLYTILKLDPYVVHRSSIADEDSYRTFMKVSISKKQYRRKGNTINPLFNYDWTMKERENNSRNHPW
ncbi:hypothetical protein PBI_SCTP2_386 [Salicola phage SCTP-2]|nr:hypothetical protein PBI_SCTP2_386 [Salicola phage SCTP-2]